MDRTGVLTRFVAIIGTVLVWFPIVVTVILSVVGSIRAGVFRFDYLMPAELFPVAIAGGGLLLWAALRARSRRRLIGWGLGAAVGLLVGGQAAAVAAGFASGAAEPVGWTWSLIVASFALYSIALIEIGIAGVLLMRDLFRHPDKSAQPVMPIP